MATSTDARLPPSFESLDVAVTLHDPETGAILDANERLAELYGYAVDELREMTVGEYTAHSTRFSQERAVERIRAAAAGDPQVFEWQVQRANGELRWVRVHLDRTAIDEATCVVAEIHDITEYKERERRLHLLSRVVRHNLRNKMTLLAGYAERLQTAVEDESLKTEIESIADVAAEVGSLSESVRQLEEIATPDATTRSPTNLADVVRSVVETARTEHSDVDLTVDAPAAVWVVADQGVRYAADHAILNAIEHNDRETPTVTVTVTDRSDDDRGVVRIADDGPPIPDVEIDVLDDAVEPTSTYHSSGIGLWVMKWCVDALGGELAFEEREPRGNVVTISLPAADGPADPA